MLRFLFILFLLSIYISCSSDKIKKRDIIEDDKFMEILKDFHKAEGVITIAKLNLRKKNNDTISPYNYVLKKHNISRSTFDKTIEYYSNNTDEYIVFYDSIMSYFETTKKEIEQEITNENKKLSPKEHFAIKNHWEKKKGFILSKMKKDNSLKFNVRTKYQGTYVLITDIFTSPKYKLFNERMLIVANYKDGTSTSSNDVVISKNPKNGKFEKYAHTELSIKTDKNKKLKSITGHILSYNEKKQHFHFNNIEIKYIIQEK